GRTAAARRTCAARRRAGPADPRAGAPRHRECAGGERRVDVQRPESPSQDNGRQSERACPQARGGAVHQLQQIVRGPDPQDRVPFDGAGPARAGALPRPYGSPDPRDPPGLREFFLRRDFMLQSTSLHVAIIIDGNGRWAARRSRAPVPPRRGLLGARRDPGRPAPPRRGSLDSHGRRAAPLRLSAVGMCLCGAVLHRTHVARFRGGRPGGRAARVSRAPATVRRAAGSGRRMSALTERTRLGLEVLATGVVLGIAGDALLRATPWGLNAFLCTVALAAAAAWLVYRRRIAVGRDAPWLAMAAVLLGSNFAIRDSDALRALDAMGLAILLALAGFSLRGVALRGRDAWEYVRSGVVAALSAWFG